MKKTLFLRLCLILLATFCLQSCQQDYLPEKETYSNGSSFQLSSKKISLKDAKHRAKLIPEIEKIEAGLKTAARNNALGKVIDYGNGVSIDTDEVVYIENGPDYHTYTFHITREGADENAPLENLVLSPLTDGTYRELLFTYTLTPAEKENIAKGFPIDTKGKVNVIELAQGTYNNGSVLAKSSCNWVETTVWVPCSENLHDGSNFQDCRFVTHPGEGTPPRAYIVEQFECLLESDPGPGSGGGGSIGGGGFGGGGSQQNPPKGAPTYPCDGSGVSTGPQQPILTDGNGTCSGTPTIPYTPTKNDPCEKAKASVTNANAVLKNSDVQSKMDAVLKGKITAAHEFAMKIGKNSNSTYSFSNLVEGGNTSADLNQAVLPSGDYIADGHSHAGGFGDPSGGDLYGFLENILTNPELKYRYVYGDNFGTAEIYALIVHDKALISAFLAQFPKSENYDPATQTIKEKSPLGKEFFRAQNHASEGRTENNTGEVYQPEAAAMAYILEKYNVGVNIAKADTNGDLKKINTSVEQIPIPNSGGAVKEGVKITKCP